MNSASARSVFLWRGVRYWPGMTAVLAAVLLGFLLILVPLQTAVMLFAGLAVALLVIVQPLFGLTLALLAGPFGALEQLLSGSGGLDSGQMLLFFTFAAWIGRGLARRSINLPYTPLNLPFLIFISVGLVSLLGATAVELGLRELLKWVEMLLIVLLVVDLGREGREIGQGPEDNSLVGGPPRTIWIVAMLLLAGVSQALIGIWQFALRGDGPEHFLVLERFYRAYGTFEQPNPFGGFMNLSLLLGLGILVGFGGVMRGKWRVASGEGQVARGEGKLVVVTGLVLVAVGVTFLGLLFSWSRGAWLGFALGLGGMVFFMPRRRIYGLLLLGLGMFIFALLLATGRMPAAVSARLTSFTEDFRLGDVRGVDITDENYSVLERQAHWQAGLDMLRDDLYLGVGFGNYAAAYPQYALLNWPDPLGHAHNYYINLLAEMGVVGLSAYLVFWTAVLWQSIRLLNRLDWPGRGVVLGLIGVWIALAAHHLVDKLYVNNIYIHLGVLLGLLQLMGFEKNDGG